MSFVNSPQHLHEDLQHLRQYNGSNLHFVNYNQTSRTEYGRNYDQRNPLHAHNQHAVNQAHELCSTELYYHGTSLSLLNHPEANNHPWLSHPQNNQLDYMSSTASPVYHFPTHLNPSRHAAVTGAQAASQTIFQNAGLHTQTCILIQPLGYFTAHLSTHVFEQLKHAKSVVLGRQSGEHPSCKRCLNRGLVCEYAKEGRVRGPNKPKPKLSVQPEMSSPLVGQNQFSSSLEFKNTIPSTVAACPPRRYVSPSILPPSMSASLPSPSSPCSTGYDGLQSPISPTGTSTPDSTVGSHCFPDPNSSCGGRPEQRFPSTLRHSCNGYGSNSPMSNLPATSFRTMAQTLPQRPYSRPSSVFQSSNVEQPTAEMISSSRFFTLDHAEKSAREIANFRSVSLAEYSQKVPGFEDVAYYPREGASAQRSRSYDLPNFFPDEGSESRYNPDAY
ncbi:hypothetical protein DFJ43DRAFT_1187523 [Lentinula guzmanii]|uniref:Uncharacterized protein n=1 Tax=Lentinula guzmanii TaxID=2804957 RepID=A0AA38N011_9AGAR|nr:hypothetical protein DFJ43DRAFT_1187523 [Lentinula guzmanii]